MSATIPVREYYSTAQTATKTCPDGSIYTLTLEAGYYLSAINQDDADMRALSIARRQIIDRLMCMSSSVPDAVFEWPYLFQFEISGGRPEYSFSVIGGALPPGLSLDDAGLLSGTATLHGTYVFTVEVRDQDRPVNVIQKTYTMQVLG